MVAALDIVYSVGRWLLGKGIIVGGIVAICIIVCFVWVKKRQHHPFDPPPVEPQVMEMFNNPLVQKRCSYQPSCVHKAQDGKDYCQMHQCPFEGCGNCKSSSAQWCQTHSSYTYVELRGTPQDSSCTYTDVSDTNFILQLQELDGYSLPDKPTPDEYTSAPHAPILITPTEKIYDVEN